jgi:hypothetical protein
MHTKLLIHMHSTTTTRKSIHISFRICFHVHEFQNFSSLLIIIIIIIIIVAHIFHAYFLGINKVFSLSIFISIEYKEKSIH